MQGCTLKQQTLAESFDSAITPPVYERGPNVSYTSGVVQRAPGSIGLNDTDVSVPIGMTSSPDQASNPRS